MTTKAFTLIEAMVAVTILTLSVVGPLTVANRAIVAAQTARDQLTASYLAQEGIEYMRAVRDDVWLALYPNTTNAWDDFTTAVDECNATSDSSQACIFNPISGLLAQCYVEDSCARLYLTTDGMYIYNGTTPTRFSRTVQVFDTPSDDDKRIVSTVSWSYHGTPYAVTISVHLTSWQ